MSKPSHLERNARRRLVAKLERSTAPRYSLAPICIAAAVLLHLSSIGPFLHPTGLFVVGIVAAAWFGGAGPGFMAALLATFVLPHFVPRLYPLIADFFDLPRFLTFAVTGLAVGDRKSTRLNSSHVRISYAVFCLKKKNK